MDRKILKDSRIHTGWNDIPNSFFMAEKLREDHKNGFTGIPFHFHQYYELYYLLEGSCVHIIGKKKYTLNPGDWILIPFDVDHRVYYNSSSHERILLRFTKDYIPYSMLGKVNTLLSNPLYIADDKHKEYVYNIMTRFVEEYENFDIYSENICRNLIYELLVLFLRKAPSDYIAETADLITDNVILYIHKNYSKNITLDELAEDNVVSPSYLSRKFKSVTGMNISEYIRIYRINQAKKMLVDTNDTISQISQKCGFSDSNYFSYVFKLKEGISPLKYRKLYS